MTSLSDLPADAAFAVLRPDPPCLVPADLDTVAALRKALELPAAMPVFHLRGGSRLLPGKYVVGEGADALFIRAVPAEARHRHQLAAVMTADLWARGAAVLPRISGFPRAAANGGAWFASPFRLHRYAGAEPVDLERLGEALCLLHRALRACPVADAVRVATAARYAELDDLAAAWRRGAAPATGVPAPARHWLAQTGLHFDSRDLMGADAQPLHGDLNYGNVCFDPDTGAPWFVDFETAPYSHLSPACDLAMVVDRFIATAPAGQEAMLTVALARGYGGGVDAGALRAMRRLLALRSLLLLALRANRGSPVPDSEWAKFTGTLARLETGA
jgi:Ser/Thr protein kinase RdoA (MazF antagonist)